MGGEAIGAGVIAALICALFAFVILTAVLDTEGRFVAWTKGQSDSTYRKAKKSSSKGP
jgi:hypothetical protein